MIEVTDNQLPKSWGKPIRYSGGTTFKGTNYGEGRYVAQGGSTLAREFGIPLPYFRVWWAKLAPNGFVVPHIDAGPFYDRWHIPVRAAGFFWEDDRLFEPTVPFQVRHWLPHAIYNPTNRERIHIIVDRDVVPEEAPVEFSNQPVFRHDIVIPGIEELKKKLKETT